MPVETEWRFDNDGKPLAIEDDSAALCVRAMLRSKAITLAEALRPQVEVLVSHRLAKMSDAPVTAAQIAAMTFAPTPQDQSDEERAKRLESRSFMLFVHSPTSKLDTDILGFARVFQDPELDSVVSTSLVADLTLSEQRHEAVVRALYHATQSFGEDLTLELSQEKRTESKASSQTPLRFYRSLFGESDFAKKVLAEHGFAEEPDRLEMSKDLTIVDESAPVFPDDVEVKSLDLSDFESLKQVYGVIKMAFGQGAPTFEAWKVHYPQQPRFAPELSFVAWSKATNEPVAAVMVERIVEGEGGGDDEVNAVFVTNTKLLAHAQSTEAAGETPEGELDEALQQLLAAAQPDALVFPADYDEKKAAIAQQATAAYVCGVATKVEARGKGLASNLLKRAFREAAATATLREITLGTDTVNASAVRAYKRAGMVVSKASSTGAFVVKEIALQS